MTIVVAAEGKVTLSGDVPSWAERDTIEGAVRGTMVDIVVGWSPKWMWEVWPSGAALWPEGDLPYDFFVV